MTRKERLELCVLSEQSFGTKYAWLEYLREPYFVKENVMTNKSHRSRQVMVAKYRTMEDVIKLMQPKVVIENNMGVKEDEKILPQGTTTISEVSTSETQIGSGDSEQEGQDNLPSL